MRVESMEEAEELAARLRSIGMGSEGDSLGVPVPGHRDGIYGVEIVNPRNVLARGPFLRSMDEAVDWFNHILSGGR